MIGCVDLIRGHRASSSAMLGLLLLDEKFQGKDFDRGVFANI
jgi:hypothetical protein